MSSLATVETRLRSAVARLRAMRALEAAVWGAAVSLGITALARLAYWLSPERVPQLGSAALFALAAAPALAGVLAATRDVAPLYVLLRFDRSHGLRDLLSSAWELARAPEPARGALVTLTIARAEAAAATLEVRRSFPWQRPRGLAWLAGAVLAAAVAFSLRPQPSAALAAAAERPGPQLERLVAPADLARFRERLARIDDDIRGLSPASRVRADLERLLEELERGPADRLSVLRRLGHLERKARLAASQARAAGTVPVTAPSDAARRAPPVSNEPAPPRPGEPAPTTTVTELAPPPPANAEAPTARDEPEDEPQPSAATTPQGSRDAPRSAASSPQGQQPATGEPGSQPPQSGGSNGVPPAAPNAQPVAAAPSQPGDDSAPRGPDLERKRANRDPQAHGEDLADAISELRDLMRRDAPIDGDHGDGASGKPQGSDPSKRDDSTGNRAGAPNSAYARGGPPPQIGSDPAEPSNEDVPRLSAAATRVTGSRSAGPVRSEVIYGAAQRGFAGRDYARVHADYEEHAERELERESIPPGYRGYVRRYFEAIAPRKTR